MKTKLLKPIHPGEILLEEFLKPMGISQYRLAKDTHVPPRRINEIVLGKRGITADTALRLARYFGTSVDVWEGQGVPAGVAPGGMRMCKAENVPKRVGRWTCCLRSCEQE